MRLQAEEERQRNELLKAKEMAREKERQVITYIHENLKCFCHWKGRA